MKILKLLTALVFLPLFQVTADYLTDRSAAQSLLDSGKPDEAAAAFTELSTTARNPIQKADALTHAAVALTAANRTDEALALADQISDESFAAFCRIRVFKESRQWEALRKFADPLDFSTWPDKLIYPAFFARAEARSVAGDSSGAEADFRKAIDATISPSAKARALYAIAQNAQRSDETADTALEAYNQIIELNPAGGGMIQRTLAARALILANAGRLDEAMADVNQLNSIHNDEPHWACVALITHGRVALLQGNPELAADLFTKAAAVVDAPTILVNDAQSRLSALSTPSSEIP